MTPITQSQLDQLLANGRAQRDAIDNDTGAIDFKPVVVERGKVANSARQKCQSTDCMPIPRAQHTVSR